MRRRRIVIVLGLLGMSYAVTPPPSPASDTKGRQACEAYCLAATSACHATVGLLFGKDKCDAFYEGCMDGCIAVIKEK